MLIDEPKKQEKFRYQETDLSRYLHAGNIMFNANGDVYIHSRATKDKELFLKILIELHNRFIGEEK
jgi:hypothetical protein